MEVDAPKMMVPEGKSTFAPTLPPAATESAPSKKSSSASQVIPDQAEGLKLVKFSLGTTSGEKASDPAAQSAKTTLSCKRSRLEEKDDSSEVTPLEDGASATWGKTCWIPHDVKQFLEWRLAQYIADTPDSTV
ncbi:hypothetical protein PPACK8108_LOCUS3030 [Phakopsora pachyrhizi]|uniref:Uncharacterized protein n=1 Tax=Phakopsora pachyrhizi TaxID=170000 RepID=A0AAV0AL06_PHAPC|nr:hypothetical protein PPACK8108_LOCUS3030 [Phakopsora pachyrhizi]